MDRIFEHKACLGVNAIFEAAKNSSNCERLMKTLFNIYSSNSQATFILEFLQCLAICMTYMERQPPVENALDFAAKYCVYHSSLVNEEEDVLLLAVFEFIFDNHNRKLPAIRFRACEFVNRLLNKMGPQASLDDDVFDKMASTMLERLQDKMPSIRAQAVLALQRLQDPPNKNCKIIKAFIYHMEADPSCEVRARVVQNIAVTQRTLPLIMGRLQDIKETVRKEAYRALTRLKPRKFSIHQRQTILTSGLSDRSDAVKSFVTGHVIPSWFEACTGNLLDFLSMLDVVSFKSETLTTILSYLFTKYTPKAELISIIEKLQASSNGKRVIETNELNPEVAVLWAAAVKHLGFDQCENVILPELTPFAKYIASYSSEGDMKSPDDQYVLMQLVEIAKLYSFMDEMGRKQLLKTSVDILKSDATGVEVIPPLTKLIEMLVPNTKERMVIMAELISDIREPLEEAPQNGGDIDWEATDSPKKENSPPDSVEALSEGISQLNCESQSLEECTRAERTDPNTLIKCLTIITEMLKSPSVNKVDATLLSLKEHFLVKCFKSGGNSRVVDLAIDALSLLSIWSLDIAKEYFLQFCIHIMTDSVSALEAVFDMLLVHGFEPFSFGRLMDESGLNEIGEFLGEGSALDFTKDPTFTPTTRRIVPLLASLLKSNVRELKCKVCEGLSKLLLSSRIDSPIVLAHLIILWFSPAADTEPLIRQPLGLFFSVFSSRRVGAPEIILLAYSPTLRGIEDLHDEEIDMAKVANLFVTLLRNDISSKVAKPNGEKGSYHGRLALIVLDEMRLEIISPQILAKTLTSLELDSRDEELSEKLLMHVQRTYKYLSKRSGERRILNVVKKFKEEVEKLRDQSLNKTKMEDTKDVKIENVPSDNVEHEPLLSKENQTVSEINTEEEKPTSYKDNSEISSEKENRDVVENNMDSSTRRKKKKDLESGKEKIVKRRGRSKALEPIEEKIDSELSDISGVGPLLSVSEAEQRTRTHGFDDSIVSESDFEKSNSVASGEKNATGVELSEGSEDIVEPSPPKKRLLRSQVKNLR